jgi:hypothetical protein
MKSKQKQRKLGVRPETYDKFTATVASKRWTYAETADIAIERLMEQENVPPIEKPRRERRTVNA